MVGFILFSSYPKSGNTWFRAVLSSALAQGRTVDINRMGFSTCADRGLFDRILGVSSAEFTSHEIACLRPHVYDFALRRSKRDIIYKVHDAWLPTFPGTPHPFLASQVKRVIYIMRDPRDVAISLASHVGKSIDHIIAKMGHADYVLGSKKKRLRPQVAQRLSTWSAHVRSWVDAPGLSVHVIQYEKMSQNPFQEFRGAFEHIGLEIPDKVIESAIEAARFEKLQKQEEEKNFVERSAQSSRFFRRGIANGWIDTLSSEQVRHIVADHRSVMERFGYKTD